MFSKATKGLMKNKKKKSLMVRQRNLFGVGR
jgi:hypothetical protein